MSFDTECQSLLVTVNRLEKQSEEKEKYSCDYTTKECKVRAKLLDALSEPTRWHILNVLMKYGGNINVYDIVETTHLEQPTISHHLRILYENGFIDYVKKGLEVFYYVVPSTYQDVIDFVRELIPITKEEVNG